MEYYELPLTSEKESNENEENELFKCKEYELQLNSEKCVLTMKINSYDTILFHAKYKKNLFSKEYKYNELIKLLLLIADYYNNINKIFSFLDISLTKNKISLLDDKDETIIKLKLKKLLDYNEINCFLYLKLNNGNKENKGEFNENDFDYKILYESIKKENEEMKSSIELLKKENEKIIKDIEVFKNDYNELKNMIELSKKENEKLKDKIEILNKDTETLKNNYKLSITKKKNQKDDNEKDKSEESEKEEEEEESEENNENKNFNKLKKKSLPYGFKYVEQITKNLNVLNFYPFNRKNDDEQYIIISTKEMNKNNKNLYKLYIMIMANSENKIIEEINTNFTEIYDIKYNYDIDKNEYLYTLVS